MPELFVWAPFRECFLGGLTRGFKAPGQWVHQQVRGCCLRISDLVRSCHAHNFDKASLESVISAFEEMRLGCVATPNVKVGSLHERDWIHFTGLTFAESRHQDLSFGKGGRPVVIRVKSVDDGYDDTSELEFGDYGSLRSIDGIDFLSLRAMYDYLTTHKDQSIRLVVRDWDMTHEWAAFPFEHTVTVEDLKSSFEQ